MARYDRKDHFYRKAKADGRASRASYKIEEVQGKYRIIHSGHFVVDLGCAPGGWLQVLAKMVGATGKVVGVDRLPLQIPLPPNAQFVQADIEAVQSVPEQLTGLLGGLADVVVSDMAPHTTGVKFQDSYRSYALAQLAWECCRTILKPGGVFVVKIFEGPDVIQLRQELQTAFKCIETLRPKSSRAGSREFYLIATHRRSKSH